MSTDAPQPDAVQPQATSQPPATPQTADQPPATPQTADQPPAPAPAASTASLEDERAQLDAERAQLDAERAQLDALRQQVAQGTVVPQAASVDLSGVDQSQRAERYKDWPQEGGSELPQPWDLRALGLMSASRELEDAGDSPDAVSPIVVGHDRPILTSGSADQSVQDLGRRLGRLGFDNSVSRGENPFGVVDPSIMSAVYAFRAAYGVEEDPSPYGGNTPAGRTLASTHIGPWTWEAVLRASTRAQEAVS